MEEQVLSGMKIMTQAEALDWISNLFEEAPGRLTPDTRRTEILAWDSLGVLTHLAGLDSEFGITISDEEVQGMKQASDILDILRNNGLLL